MNERLRSRCAPLLAALALLLASVAAAGAEVVLLVPGYLGGVQSWDDGGVTPPLQAAGWRDGGRLHPGAGVPPEVPARSFFRVALPTEAPVPVQARMLGELAARLEQVEPEAGLVLVGHSAGGVVARFAMVERPGLPWKALVTIASPHLGTRAAELGAMAGATPLAWAAPFLGGGTLNRSQWLYRDLARARPGSLLYWLNHQPHPEAVYVSIVRRDDGGLDLGELVVPQESQSLQRVAALDGEAVRIVHGRDHGLAPGDGELLAEVLGRLGAGDVRPAAE